MIIFCYSKIILYICAIIHKKWMKLALIVNN